MADDRSLSDVIKFLDPSGDMSDADIAAVSKSLKFTEVLDIITSVSKDDLDKARDILAKYDERFKIAREYAGAAMAPQSGFKPIKPAGSSAAGQEQDLDAVVNDPKNQNKSEVRQIKNLLSRMQQRSL